MILKADHVYKEIQKKTILKDINLELHSGKIYGFVGQNGSGKTMLFRALSGLIKVSKGTVSLDGQVLHKEIEMLPDIGIVIENVSLLPDLTGMQNLSYLASVRNIIGKKDIRAAISRVGLDPDDKRTYKKYSLGMKQRLAIAQAIMESPSVLMLDEPTNALDEAGMQLIRNIIMEEKNRGAMILLASHNANDIKMLAEECFYMEAGTIRGM